SDPPPDAIRAVRGPAPVLADAAPAVTRDGRRVEVGCNAAGLEDAQRAAAAGADGIGLLRSEFLFLGSERLPTEAEQVDILTAVTSAMAPQPVILRTLDVGADKPLPALPQPSEANPALGVRGLRLQLLRRPDLLADQVRAALRVAAKHPLRLMFPMVSTVDEVRQAKAILAEAVKDVSAAAVNGPRLQVGIMIEVPAAAIGADVLARAGGPWGDGCGRAPADGRAGQSHHPAAECGRLRQGGGCRPQTRGRRGGPAAPRAAPPRAQQPPYAN